MEGSSPYTENMKARAVSPFFPSYSLDEVHCLNFWYMMYGENIGTLNLYLVTTNFIIKFFSYFVEKNSLFYLS